MLRVGQRFWEPGAHSRTLWYLQVPSRFWSSIYCYFLNFFNLLSEGPRYVL